ncbi:MAG: transposase [Candidatus Saccharimonadales bacterium]
MADDFFKNNPVPRQKHPGTDASLTQSEVVTLAVFGQWSRFQSERDFYRYAQANLRSAFPTLPDRSQFNRLLRKHYVAIVSFFLYLGELPQAQLSPYEALDSSGVPTRDAKRRGAGWLAGQANIGWSNRLGWYEGFHLLTSVNPQGVITGFGFGAANTKDQDLADNLFACRNQPHPRLPSLGNKAQGYYVLDKGFEGKAHHQRWYLAYGVQVVCPPKRNSKHPWPKELRRWVAGLRQMVETVYDKLHNTFRLNRERPHELMGFAARLAAKATLHNFCIWLNGQHGRQPLAFADLLDW